jgi:beta-aspartyl-peptidase (threonine type)
MEHYWKSDDLTFSSGGSTTRGWAPTLARYLARYPTPEKMGRLSFASLEVTPLGDAAALVLGEWRIHRGEDETPREPSSIGEAPQRHEPTDPQLGNFSLVLRKVDGRWVIIHDHTSQLAP